jgi:prephenate dehydrogenase
MKIQIVGEGSFGSFLREVMAKDFEIVDDAPSVILAVPISAYNELGKKYSHKHLINVCSVQKPSTDILLKYTERVTGLHPLFGRRTPADKRHSILSHSCIMENDTWYSEYPERDFLLNFKKISTIQSNYRGELFTPELHDQLMAKTHVAAVMAAKQAQVYIDRAKDIPDELVPNSFRLLRDFVKTLDDMPKGTIESIMANPYF